MPKKYHFIHERGDYPPLSIEEIGTVWSHYIRKTVGFGEDPTIFTYQNGWCRIFCLEKRDHKIITWVFNKISSDYNYVKNIRKAFGKRQEQILAFIDKLEKTNWKTLKTADLIELKQRYALLYHQFAPYGEPLPYFLKDNLQDKLENYLLNQKGLSQAEFNLLLTPVYPSFIKQEETKLWQKVKKVKDQPQKLRNVIKNHWQRYQWLLFDYASVKADEKYFLDKARDLLNNPPKPANKQKLKKQKRQIIKKYHVNAKHQYYLGILEDLFYLMDKKKEVLTQFHFAITPLYQEAGKRTGINLDAIRWFLWNEVRLALEKGTKLGASLATKRKKASIMICQHGVPSFLTDGQGKKLLSDIKRDEQLGNKNQKEIRGIAACPGKVTGKIRYLKSARENSKIKSGEILLVSNTTPDFMPAIKKASAIITNEGGLTCHAAIVSRELNIPCIVGTKIATQVLKDGDMVNIDANKGIAKKLLA